MSGSSVENRTVQLTQMEETRIVSESSNALESLWLPFDAGVGSVARLERYRE